MPLRVGPLRLEGRNDAGLGHLVHETSASSLPPLIHLLFGESTSCYCAIYFIMSAETEAVEDVFDDDRVLAELGQVSKRLDKLRIKVQSDRNDQRAHGPVSVISAYLRSRPAEEEVNEQAREREQAQAESHSVAISEPGLTDGAVGDGETHRALVSLRSTSAEAAETVTCRNERQSATPMGSSALKTRNVGQLQEHGGLPSASRHDAEQGPQEQAERASVITPSGQDRALKRSYSSFESSTRNAHGPPAPVTSQGTQQPCGKRIKTQVDDDDDDEDAAAPVIIPISDDDEDDEEEQRTDEEVAQELYVDAPLAQDDSPSKGPASRAGSSGPPRTEYADATPVHESSPARASAEVQSQEGQAGDTREDEEQTCRVRLFALLFDVYALDASNDAGELVLARGSALSSAVRRWLEEVVSSNILEIERYERLKRSGCLTKVFHKKPGRQYTAVGEADIGNSRACETCQNQGRPCVVLCKRAGGDWVLALLPLPHDRREDVPFPNLAYFIRPK